MVKSFVYEPEVVRSINAHAKSNGVQTGIIIGQSTPQREIVVHVAPTPRKEEDHKETSESEALDEPWIVQHARQVTRMLPGGLDILGLFVCCNKDTTLLGLQSQIRQVLFAIFKSLARDQQTGLVGRSPERLQLQVCSQKITARTFDVTDYKSSPKLADWKPLTSPVQWTCLNTQLSLDLWLPVASTPLLRQMQVALGPLYARILGAVALLNGELRAQEEPVLGKWGRNDLEVDLFLTSPQEGGEDSEVLDCSAVMEVRGRVHGRAFVHSKATVQEAVQAIKQDLVRSMTARCEIQCEDLLLIEGEQQDPSLVHELPRRVFTAVRDGRKISYSDYVFHGDSACDSLDAFRELLDLDLAEDSIDTTLEQSPASSEVLDSEVEERLSEAGEQVIEAISSQSNILLPIASVGFAALAAGFSYWFLHRS